jgi:RNA polymerase primary sigma factor
MNEEYILSKLTGHLTNECQLNRIVFIKLFGNLPAEYISEIEDILLRNGIEICENNQPFEIVADLHPYKRDLLKLSNEQLCILYKGGNESALNALCKKNYGFVYSVASFYKTSFLNNHTLDDLIEYAYMGFIEAVKRFDTSSGFKLLSYAVHYLRQRIMVNIASNGFTVHVPLHIMDGIREIVKLYSKNMDISNNEIVAHFKSKGYKETKITAIVNLFNNALHPLSIYDKIDYEDSTSLIDVLVDHSSSPEDDISKKEFNKFMRDAVSRLPSHEKQIIALRYGLTGSKEKTLEEIGALLHLTRERVRQIEKKAMKKLTKKTKPKIIDHQFQE